MMSVSMEHKCSGNFIFINFKSKSVLYQKKKPKALHLATIREIRESGKLLNDL
jgi:hypothetical protein